jgi:hypothetical protein
LNSLKWLFRYRYFNKSFTNIINNFYIFKF